MAELVPVAAGLEEVGVADLVVEVDLMEVEDEDVDADPPLPQACEEAGSAFGWRQEWTALTVWMNPLGLSGYCRARRIKTSFPIKLKIAETGLPATASD